MKKTRVYFFSVCLLILFVFILYKLADIQLISTENYGEEQVNLLDNSVNQRTTEIKLSSGRGVFLDNLGVPLNNVIQKDIVVFPFVSTIELPEKVRDKLSHADLDWKEKLANVDEAIYLSKLLDTSIQEGLYTTVKEEAIPGLVAVERTVQGDPELASHLLGIVRSNPQEFQARYDDEKNQPLGISGLEQTFDSFLQSKNEEKLMYHVDAKGSPLFGLSLRYLGQQDHFYPLKIQTTIDATMQQIAEEVIDEHQLEKGGLVLLDVKTRDVLAMVSRPKIDSNQPYINNTVENQMLVRHFPGSVFKTVVAAAAIEQQHNSIDKSYDCNLDLYGEGTANRELGVLNFAESFAQSCNYTFAKIGNQLVATDPTILETYADKLGLIGTTGWVGDLFHFSEFKQFPEEEQGIIWGNDEDRYVPRAIAQTSIGQKEVKVTPLALANMAATIAQDGKYKEVRAVAKILYKDGTTMANFPSHQRPNQGINVDTAKQLQQLLAGVVDNGTGSSFSELPVAGKSGTAETGISGNTNHWFVGYFPRENPQYAMAVVDLKQTSRQALNYKIFHDVVTKLLDNR
ncbi:peptidoglycan D,D-transpeptidase FtsI family protein [Radiobacillus sp. PE A8.2]|uniref:peptidoglycan D,D-transpeptidase FtsI family protein n=1 Tax=Radiobacillus sp. PE A8.2 TaxID=3380349 RepID=UPI00388FC5FE